MRLLIHRFPAIIGLLLFALLCAAMAGTQYLKSQGATIIVTNTNDNGPGSLRQALADASDGATVQFDPALNGQTITLTTGELVIDKNITINGPGSDLLAVSRSPTAPASRIVHIMPGRTVTIQGLTISGGSIPKFDPAVVGAGIYNEQATLTLDICAVAGNSSFYEGGAIYNTGTLTVSHCTILSNFAGFHGGGISNSGTMTLMNSTVRYNASGADVVGTETGFGGGIYNAGMAVIVSSTIDNNVADANNHSSQGGGIYSAGPGSLVISNSTISQNVAFIRGGAIFGGGSITNCTISGNIAEQGGGIYVTSALQIGDTILNRGADGSNILNVGGTVTSHGYNVSSDNAGGFLVGPGDLINTDPILGPLQDNGGPTFTHELLIGSPAINSGDPNFTPPPVYDQRGNGYPRVVEGRIDIGSFEMQSVQPTPTATATIPPTASPTPSEPCQTQCATPTPTVSPTPTPTPSPTAAAQALNLSTRMLVQTGDNAGIGGFIITGSGPKRVFLRAIGPSLGQFGVPNPLADPVLELHGPPGFETIINDNWGEGNPCGDIQICTWICPQNPLESMICATLDPGAYTAIVRGNNNGSGVALIEIYDIDTAPVSKLANISTRAFVSTGSDIMIAGFVLGGGSSATNMILRGIGPSLSDFGVPNALADPTLELRDDNGALVRENDNWQDDPQQAEILTLAGLALSDPNESGIAATLAPGQYTALLAGVDGGVGNGLVEAYDLGYSCPCPTPEPSPIATATATATVGASPSPSGPCVENWDSVTAPALPPGWVASNPDPGDGTMWVTSTISPDTPPNSAFVPDQDDFSDKVLDRPGVNVTSANATLSFRNNFNTEFSNGIYWDGYMLEVSAPNISGGEFLDITDQRIGGSFVSGGYTGEICCGTCLPPIPAKRMAWSGDSGGYIDTVISLGPNLAGQTVTFRFRMCTDGAVAAPGVRIDNLVFTDATCP